jgi:acetyltransferase-like isoleucine patch superfamily enzyme
MSRFIFRSVKMVRMRITFKLATLYSRLKFSIYQVEFGSGFTSRGIPILDLSLKGKFKVANDLHLNNDNYYNVIGRQQKCCFVVGNNAVLQVGNRVGISCSTIVCKDRIEIGDHVHIGGNCEIYDSDFHDLDYSKRIQVPEDYTTVKTSPIVIMRNAFIGAHSTILKGVTIGEGAIIGACSVVTKDIPPYEIWAGNPVKFIANAPGSAQPIAYLSVASANRF